jgi:hypothetical protein
MTARIVGMPSVVCASLEWIALRGTGQHAAHFGHFQLFSICDSESRSTARLDYVGSQPGHDQRPPARINSAEVRIPYTATSYSINYESSLNLKASNGKIHKNYNRWVHNLDHDIQLNLAQIAAQ